MFTPALSPQFNTTLYSKITVNPYVSSTAHSYVLDSWAGLFKA